MNTLISVDQLKQLQGSGDLLIVDCRFSLLDHEAGRNAYFKSHIDGAFFADMETQLSAQAIPGTTGRHPLPDKSLWIQQVQQWGLNPDIQVVAYDDAGGAGAARLWWMLRWIGHGRVAVLNGGWQAWLAAEGALSADLPISLPASDFAYNAMPELTASVEAQELDAEQQLLLDARELPRFLGEIEPIDPVAGHIPGAHCSPFSGNLADNGLFKSISELQEKFALAKGDKPVVCYCGSGVTAAHNILAMVHAGLPEPSLYAGSWSEWITDARRPIATTE